MTPALFRRSWMKRTSLCGNRREAAYPRGKLLGPSCGIEEKLFGCIILCFFLGSRFAVTSEFTDLRIRWNSMTLRGLLFATTSDVSTASPSSLFLSAMRWRALPQEICSPTATAAVLHLFSPGCHARFGLKWVR